MQTLRLTTKESIRGIRILPERDRLAFSMLERILDAARPLILFDGERCLLAQTDVSSPVWIWTRSDVLPETLDELLLALTALHEQGRLPSAVSKRSVSTLILSALPERIRNRQTIAVYRMDSLCPFEAEGEMISGSDVSPDTAGEMIRRLAASAGERISYKTQREMGFLFTQNPNAYAWKTPDGRIASVAKIAFSEGRYADIHSVYTCEELRNRGYAKALITGLCGKIFESEKIPMLYADRDYPPSNRVYRQLGFTEKARLGVLRFTEPGDASCVSSGKEL